MRTYSDQNYYELLEVEPDAGLEEITKAYHHALEAFDSDSVAIYSLFDPEEQEALLSRVREAYRILSTGRTRREYDRILNLGDDAPTGLFPEDQPPDPTRSPDPKRSTGSDRQVEPSGPVELSRPPLPDHPNGQVVDLEAARATIEEPTPLPPLVKRTGDRLSPNDGPLKGADLRRLRKTRGVSMDDLVERTRIGRKTIMALENDLHDELPAPVYLKGFLRAYAQALQLDPDKLTTAYLDGMNK